MPSVHGILETAVYVRDPQRAAEFYKRLFGFGTMLDSDRLVALDVAGKSVLLLFKAGVTGGPFQTPGGTIPGHTGTGGGHFAFSITRENVEPWQSYLRQMDVPLESVVTWPGGATSLYFRDRDDNLVELITPGFWANYQDLIPPS
jgi:catechol 2,3-dioxygenase-like lactoylglutathione lyase family enzyme